MKTNYTYDINNFTNNNNNYNNISRYSKRTIYKLNTTRDG